MLRLVSCSAFGRSSSLPSSRRRRRPPRRSPPSLLTDLLCWIRLLGRCSCYAFGPSELLSRKVMRTNYLLIFSNEIKDECVAELCLETLNASKTEYPAFQTTFNLSLLYIAAYISTASAGRALQQYNVKFWWTG